MPPAHDKPAVTTATGREYFPAMDGLRAAAALMIFLVHLFGLAGVESRLVERFTVAIPVFFAISGYLLYRPWAAAALGSRPAPRVRAYYWHRFLRIVPAYWVLLAVSMAVFYRNLHEDGGQLLRLVTLQHIFVVGDMPDEGIPLIGTMTQTWSLATEIHFYLLLPLLAYVLHRVLLSRHRVVLTVLLLAALEAGHILWWNHVLSLSFYEQTMWWWLVGYFHYFAVGMVLAAVSVRASLSGSTPALSRAARVPWLWWAAAAAALAVAAYLAPRDPLNLPGQYCDLVVTVGLITPLVLAPGRGPERLMRHPLMAWLGRISYGIFLWHVFLIMAALRITDRELGTLGVDGLLVLLPVTLLASVLFGWLSYVLIENPLRRLRGLAGSRPDPAPPGPRPEDPVPMAGGQAAP
ncbi:acyltransferase [Streptomyces sp. YIM 98790]|uniref:acyltransferase family protein n=1 Tax=Streptomyces sp. YIM 98790 TaxID=2689077 RepID=UPI0014080877|nr:acyltransferase [Streptomyces sp. YIM 98790]